MFLSINIEPRNCLTLNTIKNEPWQLPLGILLVSVLLPAAPMAAGMQSDIFRASLIRKNTTLDLAVAAERSRKRLSMFMSKLAAVNPVNTKTVLARDGADYVMELAIGTPPLAVRAEVDTGSDLIWMKCSPCNGCQTRPNPLYDPAKSSTYKKLPCGSPQCMAVPARERIKCTATECGYRYGYGADREGYHYTQGTLATETLTFGEDAVEGVGFGCSDTINGSDFHGYSGLVGLGRNDLSLVRQLSSGRFSYCLSPDPGVSSPILFGSMATITGSGITSTPLVNTASYYVNLQGISVGGSRVPIPDGTFAINPATGEGGVVVDSGSPLTLLVEPAYSLVAKAFSSQMSPTYKQVDSAGNLLCFQVDPSQQVTVPAMVMHFQGLDMTLESYNYFQFSDQKETTLCLLMFNSERISLIGNHMQMGFHLLFDLNNSVLSMQAADCSKI